MVDSCFKKCIPSKYLESDLNKGESVCVDRCVAKYMDTHIKVFNWYIDWVVMACCSSARNSSHLVSKHRQLRNNNSNQRRNNRRLASVLLCTAKKKKYFFFRTSYPIGSLPPKPCRSLGLKTQQCHWHVQLDRRSEARACSSEYCSCQRRT